MNFKLSGKPLLLLSGIIFICSNLLAQQYTISGYVSEKGSGEKLIGATVYNSVDFSGTAANDYGFYSLTLAADTVVINYSYVGYLTQQKKFVLRNDTIINIALVQSNELEVVVIEGEKNDEQFQEKTQMSTMEIPIEQIKSLPAFLGEVDVFKALQLLPGVYGG